MVSRRGQVTVREANLAATDEQVVCLNVMAPKGAQCTVRLPGKPCQTVSMILDNGMGRG